jgi:hypothetical protein
MLEGAHGKPAVKKRRFARGTNVFVMAVRVSMTILAVVDTQVLLHWDGSVSRLVLLTPNFANNEDGGES